MNIHNLYITKKYDQFRRRVITESSFAFKILDFDFQKNDIVSVIIKKENDSDDSSLICQLKQSIQDENQFVFYFPFNERDFFQFQVIIERDDEKIAESAIQLMKFEGVVFNDDAILSDPNYPVVLDLMMRLEDIQLTIREQVDIAIRNNEDFSALLAEELVTNIINSVHQSTEDFKNEQVQEINQHLENTTQEIEDFKNEQKSEIDTHFEEAKEGINNIINSLSNLLDNFFNEEEVEVQQVNKEKLALYEELFEEKEGE